jgi:hypothetical protein
MPRRPSSLLAGVAAVVLAVAPAAAAATSSPAAPIPPGLQALLTLSGRQHIAYEIAQTSSVLNDGSGFSDAIATTEERLQPPELDSTSGSGAQTMRVRFTGGMLYEEIPGLARVAHGRRWLRVSPRQLGISTAQLLGEGTSVPGHPSAGLNPIAAIEALLHDASAIQDVGASVVNREPVTEFLATVSFAKLLGIPVAKGGPPLNVDVQLYFAADGLLKRLSVDLDELVSTTTDVLTVTVPVVVHPPPARDVVPYSKALARALVRSLLSSPSSSLPAASGQPVAFDITAWLARSADGPARSAAAGWVHRLALDEAVFGPVGAVLGR